MSSSAGRAAALVASAVGLFGLAVWRGNHARRAKASPKATSADAPPSSRPSRSSLPIIDIRDAKRDRKAFLRKLRETCQTIGFFYIVGHGVDDSKVFDMARVFFALPEDEKKRWDVSLSPHFRGYSSVYAETTLGQPDKREQFEFGLDSVPVPLEETRPPHPLYKRLQGPNQWPSGSDFYDQFSNVMRKYRDDTIALSEEILRLMAESLDLPRNAFLEQLDDKGDEQKDEEPHIRCKIIGYPAAGDGAADEGKFGVGPHLDYGFLTVLKQDDVGGLQVRSSSEGKWIDATPVPGSFVINMGEMMEIATRGAFVATPHRVLVPKAARVSAPMFYNPPLSTTVRPLDVPKEHLVDRSHLARFEERKNNPILPKYGENVLLGNARTFRSVVERWYPELQDKKKE